MSLFGGLVAGAMQGGGEAGVKVGLNEQEALIQQERASLLADLQRELQQSGAKLQQETHAANVETDIGAAGRMVEAKTPAMVAQQTALLPGEVEKRKQFAAVDTQEKVDEFTKLAPLKRQEAIDSAVAVLEATSTPEMLRATRSIAQAKHIVDPSYTLIPNADGTVTTFDTHSGKSTGQVKDPEGNAIIRKDPEELKAATSVINMANTNLRIAEAAYKASASEFEPAARAAAVAEWKAAQEESRRLTAPAYAILYRKAGIEEPAANAVEPPPAPGARKAPDGNWYVDDPKRPGKYLQVTPGAAQTKPQQTGGSGIIGSQVSSSSAQSSGAKQTSVAKEKPQRKPSEATAAYEEAMRNSFLTKVAERVGAGTVDFATAVGKLGWDWDHFHKTGELKRKYETVGMTPVGNSLE